MTTITTTDEARDYLVESLLPKLGDTTFQHYVKYALAGDFAYHLARYLAALPLPAMPEQAEPVKPVKEKRAPVQGFTGGIPWEMHLRAYDAYCKRYSKQQALIEGGYRGGFGTGELDMFIPGWREELSERTALLARVAELEAENSKLKEGK